PLLGAPPIPVLCSIILTSDFPLLEAEVALITMSILQHETIVLQETKRCLETENEAWREDYNQLLKRGRNKRKKL
ncbi:hypothetical protein L208DRAFT_1278780, partial [Tricholoma matsutake]